MIFDLILEEGLPKLAWCAVFKKGLSQVRLMHGSWVETGPRYFVEGAWDGPFEQGRFDQAVTFTGSGGRICERGLMFSCPTHNLEGLYSIRTSDGLMFSNSLVFLLTRAGENLDILHPNYFFDVLNHYRTGLRITRKTLRTSSGMRVDYYVCANVLVTPELTVERVDKDFGSPPSNYTDYVDFLDQTVGAVIANARHTDRTRKYTALTDISQGYDSPAISVLAARHGCQRAVSLMYGGDRDKRIVPDDGIEAASCLGLEVSLYDRRDVLELTDPGPVEMFINPFLNTARTTQLMQSDVEGTVRLTGRHGEHFWGTDPSHALPWFQEPTTLGMSGVNETEMRLRIGYLNYPAPYTLGVYAPALLKITRSSEMDPWRIGGAYDRPIPRRLLETAGVPGGFFGQVKVSGIGGLAPYYELIPPWEEDFQAFYRDKVPPEIRSRQVAKQIGPLPYYIKGKMGSRESWLRTRPVLRHLLPHFPGDRHHHRWRSRYLYTFHWGFEKTARRYTKLRNDRPLTNAP